MYADSKSRLSESGVFARDPQRRFRPTGKSPRLEALALTRPCEHAVCESHSRSAGSARVKKGMCKLLLPYLAVYLH